MRPGTGDRPAAPCRTPLWPVLRHRAIPPRPTPPIRASAPPAHPTGPRLRSGPGADTIRPVPPPAPPQAPPFRSAPADHLLPGSGPPSPPLNITAEPTLPSPPPLPAPPRTLPAPARSQHGRLPAGTLRFFRSFFVSLASPEILHLDIIKLSLVSALDFSYLWLR